MEDLEIIDQYWARDENAISETACKYGPYCRYIAYRILWNSEECVNDTYLHASEIAAQESVSRGTRKKFLRGRAGKSDQRERQSRAPKPRTGPAGETPQQAHRDIQKDIPMTCLPCYRNLNFSWWKVTETTISVLMLRCGKVSNENFLELIAACYFDYLQKLQNDSII